MHILVINGPNINMLGIREPSIYGKNTYKDLLKEIQNVAKELDIKVSTFQSNHEGEIVDKIQSCYNTDIMAIVINPAAYTHTSVAILDALKSVNIPAVEVHISNIDEREKFRKKSYTSLYCEKVIIGHGINGYIEAINYLAIKYT
ncbi:type II 3-dehydroquinate dehydratase [Criibacterium bergeronii]|uniref:3-dehydroquinate dehydratase n=1 Tax=Criibacterium bergeronii TaxID=1871336 RepID=A0A371IN03_9FIRM|nr:type II 3-dehydroquinate dehydratase [Criibacterium bergeronii]MBS6062515.1 type II 3-dehydroquinate dehydratase [Peptostreptococcaceae bacterium]RDY21873.1 type II 3-dehydroquinate dehydratase [Criibacterium bergeronii]